jgi:hypothetical protein
MASKAANTGVDPLKDLLGDVLARLEALEANAGVAVAVTSAAKSPVPVKAAFHGTLAGVRYTSTFRNRRSNTQLEVDIVILQYHQSSHFYT